MCDFCRLAKLEYYYYVLIFMLIYRGLTNASKAVFGHRVVLFEQLPNFSWTEDFLHDVIGGCQVRNFAGKPAVLRDTILFT